MKTTEGPAYQGVVLSSVVLISELFLSVHYFTILSLFSFSMSEIRSAASQSDVHQLLDSIPSHNLPPFLKTLVTSLQHLQAQVSHNRSISSIHITIPLSPIRISVDM